MEIQSTPVTTFTSRNVFTEFRITAAVEWLVSFTFPSMKTTNCSPKRLEMLLHVTDEGARVLLGVDQELPDAVQVLLLARVGTPLRESGLSIDSPSNP